jgi:hypothetical protein
MTITCDTPTSIKATIDIPSVMATSPDLSRAPCLSANLAGCGRPVQATRRNDAAVQQTFDEFRRVVAPSEWPRVERRATRGNPPRAPNIPPNIKPQDFTQPIGAEIWPPRDNFKTSAVNQRGGFQIFARNGKNPAFAGLSFLRSVYRTRRHKINTTA